MANIKSAEKRIGQTERDRDRNRSQRSRMRRAVRHLREAVSAGDASKAQELLPDTLKLIDTTAQKKIIHRNAAARTKSRLSQAVANLESS
jgi:small subunit ribosomal protein S20